MQGVEKRANEQMPRPVAILALLLLQTGCVTAVKQREVDAALRDVGFTQADADCAARRAARQMSIRELRSLQRAANGVQQPVRDMQVGALLDTVLENVDPDTLGTIARIGAECARQRREGSDAQ